MAGGDIRPPRHASARSETPSLRIGAAVTGWRASTARRCTCSGEGRAGSSRDYVG
jgi:hypothetical protein